MPTRPVGLTRDLPAGRVMRATVDGTDLVVWRADNGDIAAWNNRCPHRGMALSHGFVRGNRLACLYHGWHFEHSGACSAIPAHPDLDPPETIHAQQYSVVEDGGVIWVSVDGKAEGAASDLSPLRSLTVDAAANDVTTACSQTPFGMAMPVTLGGDLFDLEGDRVAVFCNPIHTLKTQVTVLVAPDLPLDRKRALSRWCEAVRRIAETKVTP